MFKVINIWAYCYLQTSVGLPILKAPAPRLENFWAYYTANSVAIMTHKTLSIPCETTLGIWSSSLASIYGQDTHTLEKVQQFGLRNCTRHWNSSYQDLLDIFQLPSLENRRLFLSLSTFFKIIHNLIYFPVNSHPTPLSSSLRCNHDQQYSIPFARTNHFKYSFLPNSISLWNNLPLEAANCTTLPMFKYYTLPLFL